MPNTWPTALHRIPTFSNLAHLVNPVKKTPLSRPPAAHISVIHFIFIFVSRFLHPPRHQHEPTYLPTTSKAGRHPVNQLAHKAGTCRRAPAGLPTPWCAAARGRKGRLSKMLASRRDCHGERPADQYGLTSCESPIGTRSPPQQTHRGGLTRDAQQHSGRKGRLREMLASKRARRSEHPADRPPPYTNLF